jgi:hypothetical protein
MALNTSDLASKIFEEFSGSLAGQWPKVRDFAEAESKKLAENFALIERLRITQQISEEQARLHHDMQLNSSRAVLLAVEGLGLIAVETALNAAMNVLRTSVNSALKFSLL